MKLTHLISFILTLLATLASRSPSVFMAIRATPSGRRRHGLDTRLGRGTMAAIWALTTVLGLDMLFALFPWAYLAMNFTGAADLLWGVFGVLALALSTKPARDGYLRLTPFLDRLAAAVIGMHGLRLLTER